MLYTWVSWVSVSMTDETFVTTLATSLSVIASMVDCASVCVRVEYAASGLQHQTTRSALSRGGDLPGTLSDSVVLHGRGGRGGVRRTAIYRVQSGVYPVRRLPKN